MSAPEWALTDEAFGAWCDSRGLDDDADSWALFERWIEGDPADFIDPDIKHDTRAEDFGDVFVPDAREPF